MYKLILYGLILLMGAACATTKPVTIDEFRFGDTVDIVAGEYAGGSCVVINKVNDKLTRKGCTKEYYAYIMRRGFWLQDYVCHEELDAGTVR